FVTAYANADRAAGVEAVRVGRVGEERDGKIAVPVVIRTDIFGRLRGTLELPVSGKGDAAGVDWNFALRLPGLRADEAVVRRAGPPPREADRPEADLQRPARRPPGGEADVRQPPGRAHEGGARAACADHAAA